MLFKSPKTPKKLRTPDSVNKKKIELGLWKAIQANNKNEFYRVAVNLNKKIQQLENEINKKTKTK